MSIESRIARFVAPWVRDLTPYHVADASGLIKLDAMENPYPLPATLRETWTETLARTDLNRYPDPHSRALKAAWHGSLGLGPEVGLVLGNGSDELIHLLCLAVAGQPDVKVMSPEPSFAVYRIAAQSLGLDFIGVPLSPDDFSLDLPALLAAIEAHQPAVIFLASPNNPTANRLEAAGVAEICRAAPGVVVLDEAYYRFSGPTRVGEIADHENLVVMHTLSKIGLAGLRLGALFAQPAWVELFERLRMPYNINTLTQVGACFAFEHLGEFERQIARIVETRSDLAAALADLPGIRVWPSATNFILFRVPAGRGNVVFESLREQGILVKNVGGAHASLADCLRVTVGTERENALFIAALTRALG
ncbi:MAG: histidinol-phosphate transaminase [Gammaproteobacteria bacterium]